MVNQNNELILLEQLRNKDPSAFGYLYDHYSPAILGEIIRIVKDNLIAQDILQKVFISIYISIGSHDGSKGKLITWIINMARNECIVYLRSANYRYKKQNVSLSKIHAKAGQNLLKLEFNLIYKEMKVISPKSKKILELIYVHGYTHAEAAKLNANSKDIVKTQIRKILNYLKKSCCLDI